MEMKKQIIKTAEQYGFNLEFKTCKKLEEAEFACKLNEILLTEDSSIEVDLIAQNRKLHLIVECKGASKDTALVLVKGAENRITGDQAHDLSTRYTLNDYKIPIFRIDTHLVASFVLV